MMLAEDLLDSSVETFAPRQGDIDAWDLDALKREVARIFAIDTASLDFSNLTSDEIRDMLWERTQKSYTDKEVLVGRDVLHRVERDIMLQVVDGQWKDHLYSLDHLKEGIGLRGYGQRDPLVEYKRESFELFQAMKDRVDEESVRYMWWLRPVMSEEADGGVIAAPRRPAPRQPPRRAPLVLNDPTAEATSAFAAARQQPAFAGAAAPAGSGRSGPAPARVGGDDAAVKTVRRDEPKVGRNDPCPCGSGKKYKYCCWGKGFEWETTCFDVTPISYAQMGLLPQFQRRERDIYDNIKLLLEASKRKVPPLENVPNRYLEPKANV
jgi:preprotein translocase subunit SecA